MSGFCQTPFALFAIAIGFDVASAHDLWITTADTAAARRAVVNYGHPSDRPPPAADKVVDLVAITSDGKVALVDGLASGQAQGAPVILSRAFADRGRTLIAARYDNGYWVKVTDKLYRNANKRFVPDATDSLWSAKFAKALTGPGAPWSTVLGHELELVPLDDPAAVKPGMSLSVRLLFRGNPLVDAQVERGDGITAMKEEDIPRFRTGADGTAVIPVVKPGPVLLAVDHRVAPSATPDIAAADLFNATLWFVVTGK
jgi:nickel transport protein